ncbi:hypothetical protein L1987_70169 [Smallanthus sonchifolius]|uniref:Uncharacterized protein n=1 Tax=Smallanthus sonchifolius TaxID=185202 RepID=A0ACB9APR4_9ASTR|nr:hypothetical protein L1987_70169 [Smallanthus sonchifolius]
MPVFNVLNYVGLMATFNFLQSLEDTISKMEGDKKVDNCKHPVQVMGRFIFLFLYSLGFDFDHVSDRSY